MKYLPLLIFVVGVGIAACYASRVAPVDHGTGPDGAVTATDRIGEWSSLAGMPFAFGLALMIGGALLGRRASKAETTKRSARAVGSGEGLGADHRSPRAIFDKIVEMITALPHEDIAEHQAHVQSVLDEVLEDRVPELIAHKDHLIVQMGLGPYAEMIGHFASMERNAARAWSALTDGAIEEAEASLVRAKASLALSREIFVVTQK